MHKPIIAGNWKVNRTLSEAQSFAEVVKNVVPPNDVVDAVVESPALFLTPLAWDLKDSEVKLAAQNYYWEGADAFTGEDSPAVIADLGVDYVIIGHSERREYFHETDEDINKKVKVVFTSGMTPIFCCGEASETYEAGKTAEWIEDQITKGLISLSNEQVASMVIAYKPVWVTGIGKFADANIADEACDVVCPTVEKLYGKKVSEAVRIQYDGFAKPENIAEYTVKESVDDALVSDASLGTDSFLTLLDAVK